MDKNEANRILGAGSEGIGKWNEWAKKMEAPDRRIQTLLWGLDLHGKDLRDADFSSFALHKADLHGSILKATYFL